MFQFFQLWCRPGKSGQLRIALARGELQKSRRARKRFLRPAVEQLETRSLLATILVTTEVDEVKADNLTSLREAVIQANNLTGHDTITFANSLANKTVFLRSGQITISDTLTVRGLGAGLSTVNGLNVSRLFDINTTNSNGDVTFDSLTLKGGMTTAAGEAGGAIRSLSTGQLTIQNSTISGNSTAGVPSTDGAGGGGIFANGSVMISNSTITGNSTAGSIAYGGGIFTNSSATVTGSTISGNATIGSLAHGGGIFAQSMLTVANSTISENFTSGRDAVGGGLCSFGSLTVTNSTVSGNSTRGMGADAGGMLSVGLLTIVNSTITGNRIADAGGEGGGGYSLDGPVTIRNSMVAGNLEADGSHPDLRPAGMLTVQFSLIGDNTGTGLAESRPPPGGSGNFIGGGTDATRINPQLGPLANNGGSTLTHALCTGAGSPVASCALASPALNAGSNALLPVDTFDLDRDGNTAEPIPFDQRGLAFARIVSTSVDLGALELQPTFPWHNFTPGFANDVRGGPNNQSDGHIVADDVVAIINYINAKGSGSIPNGAALGLPFGFLDTDKDNSVTASDVVQIINYINAHPGQSEGESATDSSEQMAEPIPDELLLLIATDTAKQSRRGQRA